MRACDRLELDRTLPAKRAKVGGDPPRMALVRCGRTDGLTLHPGAGWRCRKHSVQFRDSQLLTKQDLKADLMDCVMRYIHYRRQYTRLVETAFPKWPERGVLNKLRRQLVDSRMDMDVALDRYDRAGLPRREVRRVLTLI